MPNKDEIYLKLIDFGGAIKLVNGPEKEVNVFDLTISPQFTAPEIMEPIIYKKINEKYMMQIGYEKKIVKDVNENIMVRFINY